MARLTREQIEERLLVAPGGGFFCPDCGEVMKEMRHEGRLSHQCEDSHRAIYNESYLNGLHRGWQEGMRATDLAKSTP